MHHRHVGTTDRGGTKHATQVCTDFLQRKTVHAGADVMGVMEGGSTEERVKMMRGDGRSNRGAPYAS